LASPFLGWNGNLGVELGVYECWVWHFGGVVGVEVLVAFEEENSSQ
jgi:hypothetical protein